MFRPVLFRRLGPLVVEAKRRRYAGAHQRMVQFRLPAERLNKLKERLSKSGGPPGTVEWSEIRRSILDERRFTSTNVDSTVLGLCRDLPTGKSYVEFLRSKGIALNLAIVGKLLRLYRIQTASGGLSGADQEEIIRIYEDLRASNPVLDGNTCEHLIVALTLTEKWRLSFELLDMIKLAGTPDSLTYSCLIERCFQEGELETGWRLLEEQAANKRLPNDEVFLAWLEYCRKDRANFRSNLEKMLSFTNAKTIFLSRRIGAALRDLPAEFNAQAAEARMTDSGKCSHCKSTLASIVVPEHQFQALRDAFIEAVIIKKDIFNKTTPKELDRFQKFLARTKPYDVVIDGLNVAFSAGNQKSPSVYAMQLAAVVRHYVRHKKRVLVIGRQHMDRWRSKDMKYIRENAFLFFTEDLSQDDPFLLYAALESGPRTDFFSRDLMRKHSFLLGEELGAVFKRWQQEHQFSLVSIAPDGRVIVKSPFQYDLYAHRLPEDSDRWHIPLVDECLKIHKVEKQATWLCLKFE
uniref:Mitochondrial ribonuclease P catalytic subunit n=1 Tax=Culex tarsalis TaxID=7177 RepID=A0A1Q3F6U8_CULTA